MNSAARFSAFLLAALAVAVLLVDPARADVCVWRDPERTMEKIFPEAADYKTITVPVKPAAVQAIEKTLGAPLDDSEKSEFNFYEIVGTVGGEVRKLGTIVALAGKGEYGVIEVVSGLDPDGKIVGVYIQRLRERATSALQSDRFLRQFVGKTKADRLEIGAGLEAPSPDAEAASRVVATTVRKMLIFYDVLYRGGS